MKRTPVALLVVAAVFVAAPSAAVAAPTVTLTPSCDNPTHPYGVSAVLSGLPPGALFEGSLTAATGGFPPSFQRTDENGEFRIGLQTGSPLGLVTASGYHDVNENFTRDPGEPDFQATLDNPCAEPPVPGGSVSGSGDIFLFNIFPTTTRQRVSIDARSGPVGQNPTGTVVLATPIGEVTGKVTCVSVKGLVGTVGVQLDRPLPGGITAGLIDVADYSSGQFPTADILAFNPVASAPSQCPFPLVGSGGFSEVTNGTFAVAAAPPLPTTKDQCKNGGWRAYGVFKNQGDCVSFVATGGKYPPANSP